LIDVFSARGSESFRIPILTIRDRGEKMIAKRYMTFTILIAMVLIVLFCSPAGAQTYFHDDFENPAESEEKWEVITGDWQVADGVYHQLSTADPWLVSMVAADKWADEWVEYTIEFRVKPLTEGDAPVNVLFRVQDPVPQIWSDRNGPNTRMYRWIVNGWTNTESRPYIYNAGTTQMLAQTDNSLEVGTWHNIKLVVTQTGMTGYVNDIEFFDVQHAQWTNGRVGIHAYSGMIDFDDFIIYGPAGPRSLPTASGPTPRDGELVESTWTEISWRPGDFAVSHDLYIGTGFNDVNDGAAETFIGNMADDSIIIGLPTFPIPDGLVPGTTYYWRVDEVNEADPNSPWKGDIWSFSIQPYAAYDPDPVDGAGLVDPDAAFSWSAGFGAKLHYFFIGESFDDVNSATDGELVGSTSYSPRTLEREMAYYWRVDEFVGPETHRGKVWSFTTAGAAGNPQPANGDDDAALNSMLIWTPAETAVSHDLYFGTDADTVRNATKASPEYIGNKAKGSESHNPGELAWDTDYFWRVDAVYAANTVKGLVWSFKTADFITVDNFESYNDIDPPDPNSNTIYSNWIDGYGIPTNGALTSEELPPYAEQTIVHGGDQSMKYQYNTNMMISESTLTLVYPKDWTEQGVTKLLLWFRGSSANDAERMFVALNGNAVVYHDDPAASQITGWNEWVIDLQKFADRGVDLTNVSTLTIGFGTKNTLAAGGAGEVYFDDIRLIR
jgi:hypothetical protein